MSDLAELRSRYDQVMAQLDGDEGDGDQAAQRLVAAMTEISDWVTHQRELSRAYRQKVEGLSDQNEQLRQMLHALLLAIESKSRSRLADTMRDLETRLSSISRIAREQPPALVEPARNSGALPSPPPPPPPGAKPALARPPQTQASQEAAIDLEAESPFPADPDSLGPAPDQPHPDPHAPETAPASAPPPPTWVWSNSDTR